ncbi:carbon-nitrogen hydrolase family protein [Zoogloea sp.]|jgi:predicted amidohydrolase|uniref:carbon-nitrogen hydrolase family protein n=1 Tax=Zoogloea sp. TaxID=49181 RepID=UPI001B5E4AEF|nr:carbon-nitrogen hydrolase family protein [Zoogloea sp.]MBK6654646.1 carbon-nitrogen hydrolase family protein [Zoogloea sp.]MBK7846776.1 carbon-nitrogen hydrolase family protein [Zoogloea sp.]MBP7445158.1 carbon-nitrogen hydrolase family protein [Zoogloea sp.]HOY01671.1 carbon-nitrogen hydrolase family protein [Zoogloea sp.]HPI61312.1 carbon-nitrogen hydrolase family protein [Zoogloea sp.]
MNTPVCRIAAIQMVSGPEVDRNLAEADRLIGEAAAAGARLAVLPEYFPLITGDETAKVRIREQEGAGPLQDFLRDAARRHKLWLIGGSCPMAADSPDKVKNSTLVFDDDGRRVARYDKVHLFGFRKGEECYDESATIEAGNEVVAFEAPCGQVGLSICYDLRFPELFRAMGEVDLIVLPAAFTYTTGQAHWEILLRARAIENQCYVLASAQGGRHPSGRRTWGDSMIIDPWGEVLARLPEGPGVVVADLDPARIAEVRASLPALRHRKIS